MIEEYEQCSLMMIFAADDDHDNDVNYSSTDAAAHHQQSNHYMNLAVPIRPNRPLKPVTVWPDSILR
jgi:hypothetical protein